VDRTIYPNHVIYPDQTHRTGNPSALDYTVQVHRFGQSAPWLIYESSIRRLNLFPLRFRLKLLSKFIFLKPDLFFAVGIVITVVHNDNRGNRVINETKAMSQNFCTHNTHTHTHAHVLYTDNIICIHKFMLVF